MKNFQFSIFNLKTILDFKFSNLVLFKNYKLQITNSKRGMTLIETLIYIAIIGGVLGAFISFALSVSGNRNKTYAVQEVQANSRVALDIITQKIKSASGVNIASSTFDVDPGVLSLSSASSTLNPTIIQLSEDNGILQIIEGVSDPINIISDEVSVSNLVFKSLKGRGNKENIKINMTFDFANSSSREFEYSQTLQTSVSIRK